MPSQYLDEFIRELRREGDAAFRAEHASPVLIVTRAEGEMTSGNEGAETTVMAETSGWRIQQVSLLNRVFAVTRGAFEKEAPIILGRSEKADIVIPDDSISKRHCVFEAKPEGMTITDLGSTNGTKVGDVDLPAKKTLLLQGGETLAMGNFSFLFQTPNGFLAYLKRVVKI
jgi:hypothetical protein